MDLGGIRTDGHGFFFHVEIQKIFAKAIERISNKDLEVVALGFLKNLKLKVENI